MKYKRTGQTLVIGSALALLPLAATAALAVASSSPAQSAAPSAAPATTMACGQVTPGYMRCLAEIRSGVHSGLGVRGKSARSTTDQALPSGYGPADLASAYKLPATGGQGQTVAIADAYDDPNAEADLAVYRQTYGLPACTSANGCFTKVNESGDASPLPAADPGWATEISLDLDMVSAACPQCHILLVEANSASSQDLADSVNTAVSLGATDVSNSYSGPEYNGMDGSAYNHPGVPILASSGDDGYGPPGVPASYSSVIAVGGTSLTPAHNARGWTESAWAWESFSSGGAGSGCSGWVPKPYWQHDPYCPMRMVSDVSADADPATGLAVYDTSGYGGWIEVGGTSASSPFIAGVVALAGNGKSFTDGASYIYEHARHGNLNDVTTGTNAMFTDCSGSYICTAGPGYDGPTGLGTPIGTSAF